MWNRKHSPAFARMPSMRPATLNPRVSVPPAASPSPSRAAAPAPALGKAPAAPVTPGKRNTKGAPASDSDSERANDAVRAGGFHESSYELQSGLQISESEWPDDVTVPGALGER